MAISYSISYTFSPSTTISSSQVNQNFSDNSNTWNGLEAKTKTFSNLGIDTQLKSGGTVETANGTAGAPSLTFSADTATGFFRSGSTVIGVGTNNSIAMGTGKITGIGNGTAAQDAAAFGQIKLIQTVMGTSTTTFSTTSNTFQTTNLSATITPTSASNRILILASGPLSITVQNKTGYVTLARGGTNILGASGGQGCASATGGAVEIPVTLCYVDSPASTSALTYAVQIKNTDNATTLAFGDTTLTQVIILVEVV